jgi:cytochrome c peroxidase
MFFTLSRNTVSGTDDVLPPPPRGVQESRLTIGATADRMSNDLERRVDAFMPGKLGRFAALRNTSSFRMSRLRSATIGVLTGVLVLALGFCRRAPLPPRSAPRPDAATLTALGRALFFDSTLSASGRTACSSCHDPRHDWGPPNARAVQVAGLSGSAAGVRAVPSLKYAQDTPPFTEHYREDDGNDADDLGPTGGRTWDGRASSAREQAALPLLSPFEMANDTHAAVLARLRASPNAPAFRAAFGRDIFGDSTAAWKGLLLALEVFQESPADFYPYTSKFDAFLRGEAELSPREQRGLALFDDPHKGNCASCHPSATPRGGFPQFTDRGFIALGLPRNPMIPANADTSYFDLGLCGPYRGDLARRVEYCGLFKAPTLRNVARRSVFFHNGVFTRLEDVLRFYAERDVRPAQFYPRGKFDDLPRAYWSNVNVDPPFGGRPGGQPAFSDAEAADIIAFLRTLDDGYRPAANARARETPAPAAPPAP